MTVDEKIELIKDSSAAIITALNNQLDDIYNLRDMFYNDDDSLKEGISPNEQNEQYITGMVKRAEEYEKVRRKLLDKDFNLSLVEINLAALALLYGASKMENMVSLYTKAASESRNLVKILTSSVG